MIAATPRAAATMHAQRNWCQASIESHMAPSATSACNEAGEHTGGGSQQGGAKNALHLAQCRRGRRVVLKPTRSFTNGSTAITRQSVQARAQTLDQATRDAPGGLLVVRVGDGVVPAHGMHVGGSVLVRSAMAGGACRKGICEQITRVCSPAAGLEHNKSMNLLSGAASLE